MIQIISGIPRIVRQADRWLCAHKAIKDIFIPKTITGSNVTKISQESSVYKVVYGVGNCKMVPGAIIPQKMCASGNVAKIGR